MQPARHRPQEGIMTPNPQSGETTDQARHRLAQKARESGVTLRRDSDGRWYASSVSQPGIWHYVTGFSCDCLGFGRVQRCVHHSLLLTHLGWLAEDDPYGPAPATPSTISPLAVSTSDGGTRDRQQWVTLIVVDGVETIRLTGDRDALCVQWLEHGWVIHELTDWIPSNLDHRRTFASWVECLGAAFLLQTLVLMSDASAPETLHDAA
jgi:hypothetical protein